MVATFRAPGDAGSPGPTPVAGEAHLPGRQPMVVAQLGADGAHLPQPRQRRRQRPSVSPGRSRGRRRPGGSPRRADPHRGTPNGRSRREPPANRRRVPHRRPRRRRRRGGRAAAPRGSRRSPVGGLVADQQVRTGVRWRPIGPARSPSGQAVADGGPRRPPRDGSGVPRGARTTDRANRLGSPPAHGAVGLRRSLPGRQPAHLLHRQVLTDRVAARSGHDGEHELVTPERG